jgi:SAM-dependent methyltransferase
MTRGRRLCPRCAEGELISEGQAVWPVGWSCPACSFSVPVRDGIPMLAPALADKMEGMNPDDFLELANVEDGNFWFEPRNRLLISILMRLFESASDYLEVGCGNGFVLRGIAGAKAWRTVAGTELHPRGLNCARGRIGRIGQFAQMDARAIPAEGAFDVIGAFDVLEHIEQDETVLRAMHRALRAKGGLLLSVPQHPWLWSAADTLAMHVRRYRYGELESKVSAAGFRILFTASYTTLLLPLMAASRFLNRSEGVDRRSMSAELKVPRTLNWLMRAALHGEVSVTLAGVRFPIGGSRVVAAVKV